jgi:hypothetical protein
VTAQNRSRMTMLAGWLFADLFLVLLIVGLAALPAKSSIECCEPPPTTSPSTTPPPSSSPQRPRQGLDPNHIDFTIEFSPADFRNGARDELVTLVTAELDRRNPTRRSVGFVLVFASDDRNNVARAEVTATDVLNLLHDRSPIFVSSTGFGYWNGNHNNFEFKVFLLN